MEVGDVPDSRRRAGLQFHRREKSPGAGGCRQLACLGEVLAQRPLAQHGLAGVNSGTDRLVMVRQPDGHHDQVDLVAGRQLPRRPKRQRDVIGRRGGGRRLR
jgi:hypothetical protein